MYCKECGVETENPKFCSRSCSAISANKLPDRNRRVKTKSCASCDTKVLSTRKFCKECRERRPNIYTVGAGGFAPPCPEGQKRLKFPRKLTPPRPRKKSTYSCNKYTDDDIVKYCGEVKSAAALLRKLGIKPVGGNYDTIRRKIAKLKPDTSHWTGQLWSKGTQLKDWENYKKSSNVKKHLIKERGYACESCGISEWLGLPLTIEMDHIDGNRYDNSLSNLRLLCPNCHSQTPTFRNNKRQAA